MSRTKTSPTKSLPPKAYSAKRAAAGKDIGKPGKQFAAIEKKYPGPKGEKIAGAVLAKLRGKRK